MDLKALRKASKKQITNGLVIRGKAIFNPERYRKLTVQPILEPAKLRLLIGPANFAGQGYEWARAAELAIEGLRAESLTRTVGNFNFPTDDSVSPYAYTTGRWKVRENERILNSFTHVLVEAGRPITGYLHGRNVDGEIKTFTRAGLSCAVVSHGSDTRIPSNHVQKYSASPFKNAPIDVVKTLENRAQQLVVIYSKLDLPVFVSTPDLLDDLPNGVWLPVVVDRAKWDAGYVANTGKLKVLYAPSKSWIKGGPKVDEVLQCMSEHGLIDYLRITSVPADDMPTLVKSADIVIDQFAIGAYGTMAVQAMAAGKVVIGHVAPWVRERIPDDVPIVESTVDQLKDVVSKFISDESAREEIGIQGKQFVSKFHDGSYSGSVLKSWINPGG